MKQPNEVAKKLAIKKVTIATLSNNAVKQVKDGSLVCLPTTSTPII